MRPFDVQHDDPAAVARRAAVRSHRELDAATRRDARAMTMTERLRAGFALSRFSARLRDAVDRVRT